MAKITRIKAGNGSGSSKNDEKTPKSPEKPVNAPEKAENKKAPKDLKKAEKAVKTPEKGQKKHFLLFRPFFALGNYIKNSWMELRQVRWPSRKAAWKMVLSVFVYAILLMVLIALLDALFTFIFNKLIG